MMAAGKPKSRVKCHGEGEAEANVTDCRRLVFSVAHVPDAAAAFFLVSGMRSVVTRSLYNGQTQDMQPPPGRLVRLAIPLLCPPTLFFLLKN